MLVSVIIPAFNREKTIRRAVDSVLAQTHGPIELIVVDDGSTDHTADVLADYGDKIRLIRQENQGPSAARNTGIKAATGDIISFLDSDDSWFPDKTARQVRLMERAASLGVGCCVCNATMIHADGRSVTSFAVADLHPVPPEGVWHNPTNILLSRFLFFNQVVAVRREVLQKAGLFRTGLRIMEDYDLALRLSLTGPWGYIADPLVTWYGGAENSLSKAANELEVSRRAHDILSDLGRSSQWGPLLSQRDLHSRLRALRRRIWAGEMSARSACFPRLIGTALLRALRCGKSIHNRSPFAPRMLTRGV